MRIPERLGARLSKAKGYQLAPSRVISSVNDEQGGSALKLIQYPSSPYKLKMPLKWEHCKNGHVPMHAVCGGWEASNGEPLYVGKILVTTWRPTSIS